MKRLLKKGVSIWFKLFGYFSKRDIVYFESFHGKQYSDNPKAIYESLKRIYPNQKVVWGVAKGYEKDFIKEEIPYIQRFSLRWFFVMPRAKAWVTNTRLPLWLTKSNQTQYIQTWHGTPLKKIGIDILDMNIPGYTTESYIEEFKKETHRWDYLVASSPYTHEKFRQAFDYNGNILDIGFPRNDQLVEASSLDVMKMRENLKISPDKKVILYAPTWRETDQKTEQGYLFSVEFPYEDLLKRYGKDVIILVRMHYLAAQKQTFDKWPEDQIRDVSSGYDMRDLLLISDMLITDYSSCLFDFSLTNRPMIFYWPDESEYESEIRGLYMDMFDVLPGPIAHSKDELIEAIGLLQNRLTFKEDSHYQSFKQTFTSFETGKASDYIAHTIMRQNKEEID